MVQPTKYKFFTSPGIIIPEGIQFEKEVAWVKRSYRLTDKKALEEVRERYLFDTDFRRNIGEIKPYNKNTWLEWEFCYEFKDQNSFILLTGDEALQIILKQGGIIQKGHENSFYLYDSNYGVE